MRVLLVSTYDLGRQPFGLASASAWLRDEGFDVDVLDLAVQGLDDTPASDVALIAFHLPMHTATRLAVRALPELRRRHPRARVCCFGLYAPMNEAHLRALGADAVLGPEFEPALVRIAKAIATAGAAGSAAVAPHESFDPLAPLERVGFRVPDRAGLPALSRYARLHLGTDETRTVGATEASRGCRHRCRHCPIVPVYEGRFRTVPRDVVLADVRRQVEAGAEHITFGDPDFFNGIGHAMPLVRALHAEHPHLTYDVTIKIEHLRRHAEHLPALKETGCLFVTSAVESLDDAVLERLGKGHTRDDFVAVVARFRELGLVLQPTFVAFHPWISVAGYRELLATLDELDLIEHVAPVQLAIRLLVPAGSKLLELPEVRQLVGAFDPEALCHPWRHPDAEVDRLQAALEEMVRESVAAGAHRREIFARAWSLTGGAAGARQLAFARASRAPKRPPVPFLTEPWYC